MMLNASLTWPRSFACPAGERRTTMLRVWQVLTKVLAGVGGLPGAARTQRTEALLVGARK